MSNVVKKTKNQSNSITSTLLIFGVNLLMMFLLNFFQKKLKTTTAKKFRDFTDGEIVE
jgi:hypothetical protein